MADRRIKEFHVCLIHSRQTVEIRYMLPNARRFEDGKIWLPKCNSIRSRPGYVEPEVYFRVVHAAQNGHISAPVAPYCEQKVEVALGDRRGRSKTASLIHILPSVKLASIFLLRSGGERFELEFDGDSRDPGKIRFGLGDAEF